MKGQVAAAFVIRARVVVVTVGVGNAAANRLWSWIRGAFAFDTVIFGAIVSVLAIGVEYAFGRGQDIGALGRGCCAFGVDRTRARDRVRIQGTGWSTTSANTDKVLDTGGFLRTKTTLYRNAFVVFAAIILNTAFVIGFAVAFFVAAAACEVRTDHQPHPYSTHPIRPNINH